MSESLGFRFTIAEVLENVSFEGFIDVVQKMLATIRAVRDSVNVLVLTAEDDVAYAASVSTFCSDEIDSALNLRKHYLLDEFTREAWDKSLYALVSFIDRGDRGPFMICVSCDRRAAPKRVQCYGQCLDSRAQQAIIDAFVPRMEG